MAISINYNSAGVPDGTPTYLFDQAKTYQKNPPLAAQQWFSDAQLGLAVHFGLFSLLGKQEDVRLLDNWTKEDYNRLPEHFQCANFAADAIVELAIASGARYITMPARWRDGFCLFASSHNDFNSVNAKANRDLVGEMASLCEYHALGLCLEYACGHDWQLHTPALPQEDEALAKYKEYVLDQLHELLTQYGPIAAIRLDGINEVLAVGQKRFGCQELYDLVHTLQPPCLVSFGQGVLGCEDFFHFEGSIPPDSDASLGFAAQYPGKTRELRLSLTPDSLGYQVAQAGKHRSSAELWQEFNAVAARNGNLLINTALLPDGSLDLEDITILLELGKIIEKNGFPKKHFK